MDTEIDIRTARVDQLKLTQTELATALGVTLSTVWRWEKGDIKVPKWALLAVARLVQDRAA